MLVSYGRWLWTNKQAGAALDLFRNLLRVDPRGELEASYHILAIRMGYTLKLFDKTFGDGPGYKRKTEKWFIEHEIDFPEEFWDEMFEEVDDARSMPAGIELPSKSGLPHVPEIMQLKVMLKIAKSPVWRRILIPDTATFEELHEAIQHYFGWDNDHLHEFTIVLNPKGKRKLTIAGRMPDGSQPDDVPDGLIEDEVELRDFIIAGNMKITYTYDFGAMNEHAIMLEKVLPPEPGKDTGCLHQEKGEICMEGEDLADNDDDDDE